MTIYDYCAHKNPQGTAKVIASYGMRPVRSNPRDLSNQIKYCAKKHGGDVLKKLVLVHPDRELFEFERKQMIKSNASGCGCSNADGDNSNKAEQLVSPSPPSEVVEVEKIRASNEKESKLLSQNNLIIGGIIVLGLALIMKK
jgi:F420-0:gamma-glutamyl ligase